jgi:hypothetical protein
MLSVSRIASKGCARLARSAFQALHAKKLCSESPIFGKSQTKDFRAGMLGEYEKSRCSSRNAFISGSFQKRKLHSKKRASDKSVLLGPNDDPWEVLGVHRTSSYHEAIRDQHNTTEHDTHI